MDVIPRSIRTIIWRHHAVGCRNMASSPGGIPCSQPPPPPSYISPVGKCVVPRVEREQVPYPQWSRTSTPRPRHISHPLGKASCSGLSGNRYPQWSSTVLMVAKFINHRPTSQLQGIGVQGGRRYIRRQYARQQYRSITIRWDDQVTSCLIPLLLAPSLLPHSGGI